MDKRVLIAVIIVLVLVLGVFAYLIIKPAFLNKTEVVFAEPEEFLIVKPEIENYCANLREKAVNEQCPVCKNVTYVDDFHKGEEEAHVYALSFIEDGSTFIDVDLLLVYGDETRTQPLKFLVDLEGTILGSELPALECD